MKRQPPPSPYVDRWLLDPEVVFLNHGSFGATPIAVLEEQTRSQRRIERLAGAFAGRQNELKVGQGPPYIGPTICAGS